MPKKEAAEVLTVDGREVRITNPDKPYFSRDVKLSKLDLVRYYLSVAPGALAGIRDRPDRPQALRRRRRGRAVLPEARAGQAARRGCAPSRCRFPRGAPPRRSSSTTPPASRGSSTSAASSCIRTPCAPATSITPTSCASISIPVPASRGTTCAASRWRRRRCSRSSGFAAGRRRAARAACT